MSASNAGCNRSGRTYRVCATPPGGRQAVWKTLGDVRLMEARRLRDEFAIEARRAGPPARSPLGTTFAEIAGEWPPQPEHRMRVGDLRGHTLEIYELGLRRHGVA